MSKAPGKNMGILPGPAGGTLTGSMAGPSSAGPSMAGLSSAGPSRAGPSSAGPSTAGPSSAGPSTAGPSSAGPSSAGPSTAGPSSAGPSMAGPSREGNPDSFHRVSSGSEMKRAPITNPTHSLGFRRPPLNWQLVQSIDKPINEAVKRDHYQEATKDVTKEASLPTKTPVSALQELSARQGTVPKYDLVQIEGLIHEPVFHYRVRIGDVIAIGTGRSKKQAKHEAAKKLLDKLPDGTANVAISSDSNTIMDANQSKDSNPISRLQEMCMKRFMPLPGYITEAEETDKDPPHERMFTVACLLMNYRKVGHGKSKKIAKWQAAHNMWQFLQEGKHEPVANYDKEKNIGIIYAAGHGMGLLTKNDPQDWHPGTDEDKEVCTKAADYSKTMISTHVLDTTNGGAGVGIEVSLHKWDKTSWNFIQKDVTNADGRAANFVTKDTFTGGTYKFIFKTREYFQSRGSGECFFPVVEIVFNCVESEHYHVPLLISKFSYTTYRGK